MTIIQQQIKDAIRDLLAASEPSTLEEILEDVRIQCGIRKQSLLPQVITALAAMIEADQICEYDQFPIDDPLEYAWVLKEIDIQPTPQWIDRELEKIKNTNHLQIVRLTTTSGHSWTTNIAAAMTEQDAIDYFMNNQFDVSSDPETERMETVVKVEYNPEL